MAIETFPFRVLIIDDSPTMRTVCQQLLIDEAGLDVTVAASAEEGCKRLFAALEQQQPFDGLLLDWILPGMSGAELLEKINGESRFSTLSVMIFTEKPDQTAYQLASQRPNNDIQHKEDLTLLPFRMRKFLTTFSQRSELSSGWDRELFRSRGSMEGKILFVDDSATVRAKYQSLLNANGYDVAVAKSMSEALVKAQQDDFQLAIVDYYMPGGNGDELCRALLDNPRTANITIVMHSQSKEVIEQSLNAGAIDLIWKDDPANIFLMRVASIIRSLHVQRQAEQLDILLAAMEVLGVGVMVWREGKYHSFNPVMDQFVEQFGGAIGFTTGESDQQVVLCDLAGIERVFNLFFLQVDDRQEVLLVQEVTEMANAVAQAKEANQAKSQFLANMSHDLRTPLNAVLGFSQLVQSAPELPERHKRNLEFVKRSGRQLLTLINDILSMSRMEAGRVELSLESVDLRKLLNELHGSHSLFMLNGREQKQQLMLELNIADSIPHYIRGDLGRLRQIFDNLIGNAIKFTDRGRVEVVINRWTSFKQETFLQIEVRDTGGGIQDDVMEQIFNTFIRADLTREGSGLGLAICKQLIEQMGGVIDVCNNRVGGGATFALLLPLETGTGLLDYDVEEFLLGESISRLDYRMMIVDDNEENAELLLTHLERLGFTVKHVKSGLEGIATYQQWHPHLIWMDIQMPEMDGIEATARIRKLPDGNGCKIVAFTAGMFLEDHSALLKEGFDAVLFKPYQRENLVRIIEDQLSISFRRSDHNNSTLDQTQIANEIRALDEHWLRDFKRAHKIGDMREMGRLIKMIETTAPVLYQRLYAMLNDYRIEEMMNLVLKVN